MRSRKSFDNHLVPRFADENFKLKHTGPGQAGGAGGCCESCMMLSEWASYSCKRYRLMCPNTLGSYEDACNPSPTQVDRNCKFKASYVCGLIGCRPGTSPDAGALNLVWEWS